jgi:hypothetical protein
VQADILQRTVMMENDEELPMSKRSNHHLRTIVVFAAFLSCSETVDVGQTTLVLLNFYLDNLIETLQ